MVIVGSTLALGGAVAVWVAGTQATQPAAATTSAPPVRDSVAIDVCAAARRDDSSNTAAMQALGDHAATSQIQPIRAAGERLREQAITASQRGGTGPEAVRMTALASDLVAECVNAGYA